MFETPMPGCSVAELGAVLWDMDGTLVDSEKLWDSVLDEAMEWLGGTLTDAHRAALIGSNIDSTAAFLLDLVGRQAEPAALDEVRSTIRDSAANLFDKQVPWRPGAKDALAAVQDAGIPSALVTSTERALTERVLNTIGREFFQATVCGDEVEGFNKPHPRPYLRAAELLGVEPSRCVAVEDSPPGTESAVAAGCTVLVIPNDVPVDKGNHRVFRDSLVGVAPALLADLLSDGAARDKTGPANATS